MPRSLPIAIRPYRAADEVGAVAPRRRRVETLLVAAAMGFVLWFFYWTVKANSGFEGFGDLDYYRLLVRGWMKGHLHIDKEPLPELLALADPYDPAQNGPYKLGDASLYRGKYYLYFGPAPALTVMLPYRLLTGREMTGGAATFIFCTLAFVSASGLWLAIRRRYFPASSLVMAPAGVLALGFGTHLLALAQRPMIWELPISSGIAFTLLAAAACYGAIHGRRPLLMMALAGLALGLAVASRPTCLFASGMLVIPIAQAWVRRNQKTDASAAAEASWWRLALAAALPLGACGVAIMAHNYARFDHPLEWGQNYQLSGAYEGKLTHFSLRFLLHNASVYFFQPLVWTSEFPFALAEGIEIDHIPGYFGTEEVCGLAVTFPFIWFALALPLAWWRRDNDGLTLSATLGVTAAYAVPVMGLVLCYFSTTMRYQTDFSVVLTVLALIGLLSLERWVMERTGGRRARRWLGLGVAGLAIITVVVGALVSFDYHNRSMSVTSPGAWARLTEMTNERLGNLGQRLGQIQGPRVLKVRFKPRPEGAIETFWRSTDLAAAEHIVVEHIGSQLIRFGYRRGETPWRWGRPLRWEKDHTHTVEVQVPSLYPAAGDGWWEASRRRLAFRERTAVAVWFSGGRALEAVMEPLPTVVPGGEIGADFSGEVRRNRQRLFRRDEIATGWKDMWEKRGGTLQMHVVFPPRLHAIGEPLFAAGAHYRSSIVFAEPTRDGVRLVFENFGTHRAESVVFRPDPRGHLVELEMPFFQPEAYGIERKGEVVLRVDGREILRTVQTTYEFPWGEESVGRNPYGTTCGPEFTGWIREATWRK